MKQGRAGPTTSHDRETLATWRERLERQPHLYRYASIRDERFGWVETLLLGSQLYFPVFPELNDPFDGDVQLDYDGTPEEIEAFWADMRSADPEAPGKIRAFVEGRDDPAVHARLRENHREGVARFGVACFSEVPDDLAMWAYYADGHRGVCLRFRTESLWKPPCDGCSPPMPVEYEDEYPNAAFYRDSWVRRGQVALLTKARAWSHEREWRIVRGSGGLVQVSHGALDGIVLGCKISSVDDARIRDLVSRRTLPIEVLRAHPAEREFKLHIESA